MKNLAQNKKFAQATWQITEQLLEVDSLEEALSKCLEIIVKILNSQAGTIWFKDEQTGHLVPIFHIGPSDISGVTVDDDKSIEMLVTKTGKSVRIEDASKEENFEGSVFDKDGFVTSTMLCVPFNDSKKTVGCVQIINKNDDTFYDEEELELCERMVALVAIKKKEKGLIVSSEKERKVLISLRNVTKEYPSGNGVSKVLEEISFDIYENEFVVILGESGCGKSTMMNIIGGMDFLTEGKLIFDGKDFSHPSDEELTKYRREYLGFIFQTYDLIPNLTALENIQFIAEISKDPADPKETLNLVGLGDKGMFFPAQMSGGQQQRVSIARALVKNPRLILADEPTAALDYQTGQEVLVVMEKIVRERGTTVVMITHNAEIAKMADRVIKLRSGKIASIKRNLHPLPAAEIEW